MIEGYTLDRDLYHPGMSYIYEHTDIGMSIKAIIYSDHEMALKWCEDLNKELLNENNSDK